MATFLDIGLLQKFEIIFPFLLVFIIFWGIFGYSKFLGENKFLHALVALILAILVLFSDTVTRAINSMAPWFVLIIIFMLFLLMMGNTVGLSNSEMLTDFRWLRITFVIIFFVIFIFNLIDAAVWDEDANYEETNIGDGGKGGVFATLRHPLVLGLILIFLIGVFTIQKLSTE